MSNAVETLPASGYSPLGMTVKTVNGVLTFDFAGHVSAVGVDLPIDTPARAGRNSRVRWLRSDGSVPPAEPSIYAYESNPPPAPGTDNTTVRIDANVIDLEAAPVPGGGNVAALIVQASTVAGGGSRLQLRAGGLLRTLLDSANLSDWVQLDAFAANADFGNDRQTNTNVWEHLAAAPSVTVPRNGSYLVSTSCPFKSAAAVSTQAFLGIDKNNALVPAGSGGISGGMRVQAGDEGTLTLGPILIAGLVAGDLLRQINLITAQPVDWGNSRGRGLTLIRISA
jgi:hypothetical protein